VTVTEEQQELEWEARAGRLAAVGALVAAALIVISLGYRLGALPHGANNVKEFLPQVTAHKNAFLVSGILTGLGMLAFIPPLLYLYQVTRFRRHELPPVTRILIYAGPILFAICSVWFQFRQAHAADVFAAGTVKTNKHAEDVLRNATTVVAGLSLAASIGIGFATIMTSLNAMRAGLLSRFMGVLGMILGALFVLPLIASPVVQLFWLLALGALFLGRWPGGRGPAWETGEAIPWPSPQRGVLAANQEADGEPAEDAEPEPATAPRPRSSRKRKRKARR
jgi:hypothetical protein